MPLAGHFGAIAVEPLTSLANIENLCQAGSTRLLNWIQQNCRPDCAIQPRFQFVGSLYDSLSITSLYGSEAMLRYMLETLKIVDRKDKVRLQYSGRLYSKAYHLLFCPRQPILYQTPYLSPHHGVDYIYIHGPKLMKSSVR